MNHALAAVVFAAVSLLSLGCATTSPGTKPEAALDQRELNLQNIVLATRQVAIDDVQAGRYPPDIQSLVRQTDLTASSFVLPGKAAPALADAEAEAEWVQQNSDYRYLGGGLNDSVYADIVLAHEKPELLPPSAPVGVAYADGSVAFLPRTAFEKALQTYTRYRQELAAR